MTPLSCAPMLRTLTDKTRKTVAMQFETLEALRQSVVGKVQGTMNKRSKARALAEAVQNKMLELKKDASTDLESWNHKVNKAQRKPTQEAIPAKKQRGKAASSSDDSEKDDSSDKEESCDSKPDTDDERSDDEDTLEETQETSAKSKQTKQQTNPSQKTLLFTTPDPKTSSRANDTGDDDLFSHPRFSPPEHKKRTEKPSPVEPDNTLTGADAESPSALPTSVRPDGNEDIVGLREMLTEVTQQHFKNESDACILLARCSFMLQLWNCLT